MKNIAKLLMFIGCLSIAAFAQKTAPTAPVAKDKTTTKIKADKLKPEAKKVEPAKPTTAVKDAKPPKTVAAKTMTAKPKEPKTAAEKTTVKPAAPTAKTPTVKAPKTPPAAKAPKAQPTAKPDVQRSYIKGPKGGCFYMSGKSKVYVDKGLCQ